MPPRRVDELALTPSYSLPVCRKFVFGICKQGLGIRIPYEQLRSFFCCTILVQFDATTIF